MPRNYLPDDGALSYEIRLLLPQVANAFRAVPAEDSPELSIFDTGKE